MTVDCGCGAVLHTSPDTATAVIDQFFWAHRLHRLCEYQHSRPENIEAVSPHGLDLGSH